MLVVKINNPNFTVVNGSCLFIPLALLGSPYLDVVAFGN